MPVSALVASTQLVGGSMMRTARRSLQYFAAFINVVAGSGSLSQSSGGITIRLKRSTGSSANMPVRVGWSPTIWLSVIAPLSLPELASAAMYLVGSVGSSLFLIVAVGRSVGAVSFTATSVDSCA